MKFLTIMFTILTMSFSQLSGFATLAIRNLASTSSSPEPITSVSNTPTETQAVNTVSEDTAQEGGSSHKEVGSFITVELEGYCTIEVPQTHFKDSPNYSSTTQKQFLYTDDKSKVRLGFVTNLQDNIDVAGFITQEVAGVDIMTNDKQNVTYGDKEYVVVNSPDPINGLNVRVYYLERPGSAFWARVEVAPDSDDEEFESALAAMFQSIQVYYLDSGSVFETPTTGIYETMEQESSPSDNQDRYTETSMYNTLFGDRGGYVEDADIPTNWTSMQMIVDGEKIQVPCTPQDLYSAGFRVNQSNLATDDDGNYLLAALQTATVNFVNDNGTVIVTTIENESGTDRVKLDDCSITSILVDRANFTERSQTTFTIKEEDVSKDSETLQGFTLNEIANITKTTYNKLNDEERAYVDEVRQNIEEGRYKNPDALYGSDEAQEMYTDEELEILKNGGTLEEETATEETATEETETDATDEESETSTADETSESETSENETSESEADESTEETSEAKSTEEESTTEEGSTESETSTESEAETTEVESTLILPGGITWDVYTDDLVAFYGSSCTRTRMGDGDYLITYTSGDKKMELQMGLLQGIVSVKYTVGVDD